MSLSKLHGGFATKTMKEATVDLLGYPIQKDMMVEVMLWPELPCKTAVGMRDVREAHVRLEVAQPRVSNVESFLQGKVGILIQVLSLY